MKFKVVFLLAIIWFVVGACKKSVNVTTVINPTTPPPTTGKPDTDVYISGSAANVQNLGAYWKNNTLTLLSRKFTTTAVATQGTDVYLVGHYTSTTGGEVAGYWKNGSLIKLSDSSLYYYATGIAIQGSDVYVCGFVSSNFGTGTKAMYWKNGVSINLTLPTGHGTPTVQTGSITVQGGDVYVAGTVTLPSYTAVYWKNGSPVTLPSTNDYGQAIAIAINGTDVYVAGNTSSSSNPNISISNTATYWKNGVVTQLASNGSDALSIAIQNNDVYIAGDTYNNTIHGSQATYWKNGIATVLPGGSLYWQAMGIATNGTDVHIVGTSGDLGAVYWKNNKLTQLTSTRSSGASGISIAIH